MGPALRALAEREGSRAMTRAIHIGGLKLRVARGRIEVDDFAIDGRDPRDRPFFTAKRLSVSLDWSGLLSSRPEFILTSVEMTDWNMLVEKFDQGDNFPRFQRNASSPGGP